MESSAALRAHVVRTISERRQREKGTKNQRPNKNPPESHCTSVNHMSAPSNLEGMIRAGRIYEANVFPKNFGRGVFGFSDSDVAKGTQHMANVGKGGMGGKWLDGGIRFKTERSHVARHDAAEDPFMRNNPNPPGQNFQLCHPGEHELRDGDEIFNRRNGRVVQFDHQRSRTYMINELRGGR